MKSNLPQVVPLLDKQHLARLRQLQDGEEDARLLVELAGSFLARAAAQLQGMRALLAEGQVDTLAHEAHAVAGSSGMFGMPRVRQRCLALENAVRAGALEGAEALLAAAGREFELARPELMAELGMREGAALSEQPPGRLSGSSRRAGPGGC